MTHPILIFFDNLKIFFVDEHKNGGSWLPCPLPKYCKIIVSFQQEETDTNLAREDSCLTLIHLSNLPNSRSLNFQPNDPNL